MLLPNTQYPIIQIERLIKEGEINKNLGYPVKGITECINNTITKIEKSGISRPLVHLHTFIAHTGGFTEHLLESRLDLNGFLAELVAFDDMLATMMVYNTDEWVGDIVDHPERFRFATDLIIDTNTHMAKRLLDCYIIRIQEKDVEEDNE